MNRTQKKCLVASGGFHALLLLIVLVGPAFLTSRDMQNDMAVLDYIPLKAIDAAFSGGGNPSIKSPPRTTTQPQQQPQQQPPTPAPPVPKPIVKVENQQIAPPDPKPPIIEPVTKPVARDSVPKDAPEKIKINTKLVARNADPKADQKSREQTQRKAEAEALAYKQLVQNAVQGLREDLSGSTSIEIPGPGGAAYANYAQIVKSIYTAAWIVPDEEVDDDNATVKVMVRIAREGRVLEARIVTRSGSTVVDRSVQRALNRVDFIRPFPEGAKEKERKFNINFNLKAKRLLG